MPDQDLEQMAREARSEICADIRRACTACSDGVIEIDRRGDAVECEYCGRPMLAVDERRILSALTRATEAQRARCEALVQTLRTMHDETKRHGTNQWANGYAEAMSDAIVKVQQHFAALTPPETETGASTPLPGIRGR